MPDNHAHAAHSWLAEALAAYSKRARFEALTCAAIGLLHAVLALVEREASDA